MFGDLELKVLQVLWSEGESDVHDVVRRLDRPLAYTTIMTTLDRLFKKGLLERRKDGRAFRYMPRFSQAEWERRRADEWFAGFLATSPTPKHLLLSSLVDAVGERDSALLDELEQKILLKRKQLRGEALP